MGQRCALPADFYTGEEAPHNEDTVSFSTEEFSARILSQNPAADLSGSPESWFGAVSATEGGGVEALEIGGVSFTGKELRSLLGLRSTVFAVSVMGDEIFFQTRGYGHRVGMSQYGADAMAVTGSTCPEILALLKQYGVTRCYYGHLHADSIRLALEDDYQGVQYRLVSADHVDFQPQRIG